MHSARDLHNLFGEVLLPPLSEVVNLASKLLPGLDIVAQADCCRYSRAKDDIGDGVLFAEKLWNRQKVSLVKSNRKIDTPWPRSSVYH